MEESTITFAEAADRITDALWRDGYGADALKNALPQLQALAKAHYMDVALNTRQLRSGDPGIGIETGAMLDQLTQPIVRDDAIVFESTLDYAMEQEERLQATYGKSFLPDPEVMLEVLRSAILAEFSRG